MRKLLLLVPCALLAACATTYQAKGLTGGFSEVRRTDTIYQVRFEGNGYTTAQHAEDMALMRAAELTLEKGFRYFTLLDESTRIDRTTGSTAPQFNTTGRIDAFGNYRARTTVSGGETFDVKRPTARLLVGMAPTNEIAGFIWMDAGSMLADLRPKQQSKPAASSSALPRPAAAAPSGGPCFVQRDGKCVQDAIGPR